MPDLYTVLGVERTADQRSIRDAYRRLARRHHPDAGGDQDRMMVLNKAWHILGDPERRAAYDARRVTRQQAKPKRERVRDGETVLDFGRYAGWTLREVAREDDNYLHWLERTQAGRAMRKEIGQILDGQATVMEATRSAPSPAAKRRRWGRG